MTTKPLLLVGANGRTGRAILIAMVRRNIPVRAFIRDPAQAASLTALGAAEIALGDLTDVSSIKAAMSGAGKLLHIGPPMHPQELEISTSLFAAAGEAGVGHVIYYSVMHPLRREVRHHRLKLDAEERLIESGLAYTILQPSRYMEHLIPIWARVNAEGVHAMPFDVTRRFNIVALQDLAEACAIVAGSDAHHYATYELAGPEALSQQEMAATIAEVIGRPVRAEAVPFDLMTEKARASGADEDRVAQMLIMNRHYDAHGFRGNANVLTWLIGRPATTFRAFVQALADR